MLAVRRFTAEDAPVVTTIIRGLPDYFTDDVPARAERDAASHEAWVISDSGTIAGFAVAARKSAAGAEILWIAVDAERRGRGHGTKLLGHILDHLAANGISVVEAKTLDRSSGYRPYEATGSSGNATGSCTSTRSTRCPAGNPATRRPSTWPRSAPPGDKHVSQPRLAKTHRVTVSSMAEEWRVSLVTGGAVKGSHYRDLLRNRLGDDIAVSAAKTHLYLYAGSVKAAEEAGQVARAVLEEQGQFAEVRLERWDPAGKEWRVSGEPTEHEDEPEPDRVESTVIAFIKGAGQALQWGSP